MASKSNSQAPVTVEFRGVTYVAEDVVELLSPRLTPERLARVDDVLNSRLGGIIPVMENIYDRGNTSAVMRSAEAMGLYRIHIIEKGERFKEANRVTQGADKWLEVMKWRDTSQCVRALKAQGVRVYATHLERADPIESLDFTQPTALVFGNEKEGVSEELLREVDGNVIIPMYGFVQSFNISVAAALCFYQATMARRQRLGVAGDLDERERLRLKSLYYLRSLKCPEQWLKRINPTESAAPVLKPE